MEAIILAGGFGTRLKKLNLDVPKPMVPVAGKPFLEYLMTYLAFYAVDHVILSVGYLGDKIEKHFGTSWRGMSVSYAIEDHPLGTGGGVKKAMQQCREDPVWVLNGDTFFDVNLRDMTAFHKKNGSACTIAGKRLQSTERYGLIRYDSSFRIIDFEEKNPGVSEGVINGGVYLINKRSFLEKSLPETFSMEHDFLEVYVRKEKFMLYLSDGYFIDIGIPEDLKKAQDDSRLLDKYE